MCILWHGHELLLGAWKLEHYDSCGRHLITNDMLLPREACQVFIFVHALIQTIEMFGSVAGQCAPILSNCPPNCHELFHVEHKTFYSLLI